MAFKPIGQITPFLLQPGSRVSLELPWECPALKSEALLDIVVEVEGHTPQCVFQGLPPVPDILPKLQRCVFNIIPKEPLIMHNSVCYGFDGGNPQLIWEIWTPDKANKLGEGTTSVASDEPTQRLYWRDFGPGRYCLKRILATDKGVMAEKEENIVLVIEPWR